MRFGISSDYRAFPHSNNTTTDPHNPVVVDGYHSSSKPSFHAVSNRNPLDNNNNYSRNIAAATSTTTKNTNHHHDPTSAALTHTCNTEGCYNNSSNRSKEMLLSDVTLLENVVSQQILLRQESDQRISVMNEEQDVLYKIIFARFYTQKLRLVGMKASFAASRNSLHRSSSSAGAAISSPSYLDYSSSSSTSHHFHQNNNNNNPQVQTFVNAETSTTLDRIRFRDMNMLSDSHSENLLIRYEIDNRVKVLNDERRTLIDTLRRNFFKLPADYEEKLPSSNSLSSEEILNITRVDDLQVILHQQVTMKEEVENRLELGKIESMEWNLMMDYWKEVNPTLKTKMKDVAILQELFSKEILKRLELKTRVEILHEEFKAYSILGEIDSKKNLFSSSNSQTTTDFSVSRLSKDLTFLQISYQALMIEKQEIEKRRSLENEHSSLLQQVQEERVRNAIYHVSSYAPQLQTMRNRYLDLVSSKSKVENFNGRLDNVLWSELKHSELGNERLRKSISLLRRQEELVETAKNLSNPNSSSIVVSGRRSTISNPMATATTNNNNTNALTKELTEFREDILLLRQQFVEQIYVNKELNKRLGIVDEEKKSVSALAAAAATLR